MKYILLLACLISVKSFAVDYNSNLSEEYNEYLLSGAANNVEIPQSTDVKYSRPIVITQTSLERRVGYTVGDLLTRKVWVMYHIDDTLDDKSLPLPGSDVKGVEVRKISVRNSCNGDNIEIDSSLVVTDRLSKIQKLVEAKNYCILEVGYVYQVFTSKVVAKPAALPPEYYKFKNKKGVNSFARADNIKFRISPLAVYGNVDLIEEIGLDAKLPPINKTNFVKEKTLGLLIMAVSVCIVLMFNVGLYIVRKKSPFSNIYKDIKKGIYDNSELQLINEIRRVLNTKAGHNVFEDEVVQLNNKIFKLPEVQEFYKISSVVLFGKDKQEVHSDDYNTRLDRYLEMVSKMWKEDSKIGF